jgi:Skp family chaperone for outer membrane proteins
MLKSAMIAGLMLGVAPLPALAQSNGGTLVQGLAVADLDGAVANSNAFRTAQQQRQTTYKPQLDQAETRRKAITAQLQPMVEKFNKDRQANVAQATLQQQAQQIQQIQESGQQELQRILQPVGLSEAYVQEQISEKLDQAVKNAMSKKKISILIGPDAVLAVNNNAYNITTDITTELNTLIPSAQIVPPQGWEPRQVREARAAQQQQGQAAPAAGSQPQGR